MAKNINGSFLHVGKTEQIGQQIIQNYGPNQAELEKLRNDLAEQLLGELPVKISQDTRAIVDEIVGHKVDAVLLRMDEKAESEEDLRESVSRNFEDLHKDMQSFKAELEKQFAALHDEDREELENLERLSRDAAHQADEAFGKIINTLSKIEDIAQEFKETIRLDYTFELLQGWVNIREGRFDTAKEFFEKASRQMANEAEAYFGMYLADCKIQVLWDCVNCRWQPIYYDLNCKLDNNTYYATAMHYASDRQSKEYAAFNEEIKYIMHEFEKLEDEDLDYDCFICVKVSDKDGNDTRDSKEALKIYKRLDRKYSPFYSEIQIEKNVGKAYEAHILYALYKAKCMIVVCFDREYLQTPWVKNEYTRYIDMMNAGKKQEDSICIVYDKETIKRLPGIRRNMESVKLDSDATLKIVDFVEQFVKRDEEKTSRPKSGNIVRKREDDHVEENSDAERTAREEAEAKVREAEVKVKELEKKLEEARNAREVAEQQTRKEEARKKKDVDEHIESDVTERQTREEKTSKDREETERLNHEEELKAREKFVRTLQAIAIKEREKFVRTLQAIAIKEREEVAIIIESMSDEVKELCQKAQEGDAEAQYRLGESYYLGNGVVCNRYKAADWFAKAAEQEYAAAQYKLAECYSYGRGVKQDGAKAVELYTKAAEQGYAEAQYKLGQMYYYGRGVKKDREKAAKLFAKAAAQGNAEARQWVEKHKEKIAYTSQITDKKEEAEIAKHTSDEEIEILKHMSNEVKDIYNKATEGDATAQYRLGGRYYLGRGVTQDCVKAVEWFAKAAEQGYAEAQYKLADCYWNGIGVAQDGAKSAEWFTRATEQGHASAQYKLGQMYYYGRGVKKDRAKAAELITKSATNGNVDARQWIEKHKDERACAPQVADKNKEVSITKDMSYEVRAIYIKAKAGDVEAQYQLGERYYLGSGVSRNSANAVEWWTKCAEQGFAKAQFQLGDCYWNGRGVTQSRAKALEWYTRAVAQLTESAEQGDDDSQYKLGQMYYYGRGVKKDRSKATELIAKSANQGNEEAIQWLRKEEDKITADMSDEVKKCYHKAKAGDAEAQYKLADCYWNGRGVAQDHAKAIEWWTKSAEQGHSYAQGWLGLLYYNGWGGVEIDYDKAVEWLTKAVAQGYPGKSELMKAKMKRKFNR